MIDKELQRIAQVVQSLRGAHLRGMTIEEITSQLLASIGSLPQRVIFRDENHIWYRARKSKDLGAFTSARQMIYPPGGGADYGRASLPGKPVLYAAWNRQTAMEEIAPEIGDVVQIVALRVRPGIQFPCVVVGEFQRVFNSGRSLINSSALEAAIESELRNPTISPAHLLFGD